MIGGGKGVIGGEFGGRRSDRGRGVRREER